MFNFENHKQIFEKNQNITYGLSLDDFEDNNFDYNDNIDNKSEESNYSDIIGIETDFEFFLKLNVFKVLNINVNKNNYAWKRVLNNGEVHYIAYIKYLMPSASARSLISGYTYDFYIDLNETTKALCIGNCISYKTSKYFKISYPIIKICEHYIDGPVYIGDIYIDKPYALKIMPENILKNIDFPFYNVKVLSNISIWRTVWNGQKYFLPEKFANNEFMQIEKKLILSKDFILHFAGFTNEMTGAVVLLFYKMFESFNDFAKFVYEFCKADALVKTDFDITFDSKNYLNNIELFDRIVNKQMNIEKLVDEKELKIKQFFLDELPQSAIDHFESINEKSPNLLSVKTMFKERKSKDPYRKLDLPIIKLILKDNGIDVDKIINDYEKEWTDNFYKFVNIFYKHCINLKLDMSKSNDAWAKYKEINFLIDNIFVYGRTNIKFHTTNGELKEFDGLTNEELDLIKNLEFGLKPNTYDKNDDILIDISKLNDKSESCLNFCKCLLDIIGTYSESIIIDDIDNHTYNLFIILLRFIYLFYVLYINDQNMDKPDINPLILYNMKYNLISFNNFSSYCPFNFSDFDMKLNTYSLLYKFLEYTSYVIENGYDIKRPNIGGLRECQTLFKSYGIDENINDIINNEFNISNKPNVSLLNKTSIYKMFSTIFTNIDKKI